MPPRVMNFDLEQLGVALGLILIIEGLMPFISPSLWKDVFKRILEMRDGQIRFFGLILMILGLLVLSSFS